MIAITGAAATSQPTPNWLSTTIAGSSTAGCTSSTPFETRPADEPVGELDRDPVDDEGGQRDDRAAHRDEQQDREDARGRSRAPG